MAYSRNKYKLTLLIDLPKGSKLINVSLCGSIIDFLKEKKFYDNFSNFYLFEKDGKFSIIVEAYMKCYLAIKMLEETNDKDSIQTKDEIFFTGVVK